MDAPNPDDISVTNTTTMVHMPLLPDALNNIVQWTKVSQGRYWYSKLRPCVQQLVVVKRLLQLLTGKKKFSRVVGRTR
jgi:hypothetical protein